MYVVRTNLTFRRYRARIRCENLPSSLVNGITDVRYEMWSVVGSDLNSFVFRTTLFKKVSNNWLQPVTTQRIELREIILPS